MTKAELITDIKKYSEYKDVKDYILNKKKKEELVSILEKLSGKPLVEVKTLSKEILNKISEKEIELAKYADKCDIWNERTANRIRSNEEAYKNREICAKLKKEIRDLKESNIPDVTDLKKVYNGNKKQITFSIGKDKFLYEEIPTGRSICDGEYYKYETTFKLSKNGVIIKNSTSYVHELAESSPSMYGDIFNEKQCRQLK